MTGSRGLHNLGEIQQVREEPGEAAGGVGGAGVGWAGAGGERGWGGEWYIGTYDCELYKGKNSCDVCSHMLDRGFVQSEFLPGKEVCYTGKEHTHKKTLKHAHVL